MNKKKTMVLLALTVLFALFIKHGDKWIQTIMNWAGEGKQLLGNPLFTMLVILVVSVLGIIFCWCVAQVSDVMCSEEFHKSQKFEEKHPRLNIIIALFVVCIIADMAFGMAFYIIKFLGKGIILIVNWLSNVVSKLDAVIIVALITGAVSIVGVIISSIVAKVIEHKKEKREYLAKKRETPYGEFVDMLYKIQQNSKGKKVYTEAMMLEDLSKFSKQITLWGSPKVVKKWIKFRENGANPNAGMDNLLIMDDIMNEMRKDLGLKKMKQGDLLGFFVNDIRQAMKNYKK